MPITKKTYFKLTYFYSRELLRDKDKKGISMVYEYLQGVLDCMEIDYGESDNPNEGWYKLQTVKMTESEFKNLPEFEGH